MVTKFVAPKAIAKPKSAGADTTATIGGDNPRGQVIGVPSDWVPSRWIDGYGPISQSTLTGAAQGRDVGDQGALHPVPLHSLYREADAFLPANDPSTVSDIQQKLIKAGLLDPAAPGYVPGLWGANEIAAYRSVLSKANVYGVDRNTMLDYIVAHPGFDAKGHVQQVSLSSPISIEAAFKTAFKATLGHDPTASQVSAFVGAYSGYEKEGLTSSAAAQASYAKDPTHSPSTITDTASPSDYAQQYIDTQMAGEEAGSQMQTRLDALSNLISGAKNAGG